MILKQSSRHVAMLTILPILAGWFNDYIIYQHLLDTSQTPFNIIRFLAIFDFAEKLFLSALTGYFLLNASRKFQQDGNRIANKWIVITVFSLLAFESMMRLSGSFGWMGSEIVRYKIAAAQGLNYGYWSCLPFSGLIAFAVSIRLCKVGKSLWRTPKSQRPEAIEGGN